jgi:opacity protein-like surface antigen
MLPYPEFLYGDKLIMISLGLGLSYEVLHNLFGYMSFNYYNFSNEKSFRTPGHKLRKKYSIGIFFGYGF